MWFVNVCLMVFTRFGGKLFLEVFSNSGMNLSLLPCSGDLFIMHFTTCISTSFDQRKKNSSKSIWISL